MLLRVLVAGSGCGCECSFWKWHDGLDESTLRFVHHVAVVAAAVAELAV